MEVDEKPTEQYSDIGGLGKQIQELREAIVLPMTHAEEFKSIGITPPKGALWPRARPADCVQRVSHSATSRVPQAFSCTGPQERARRCWRRRAPTKQTLCS